MLPSWQTFATMAAVQTRHSIHSEVNNKGELRNSGMGDIEKQYGHMEVTIRGGPDSDTESEKDIPVREAILAACKHADSVYR